MNYQKSGLWISVAILCLAPGARAQTAIAETVVGQLQMDSSEPHHSVVSLTTSDGERVLAQTDVRGDGTFTLQRVPFGEYSLVVSDGEDHPLHQQPVEIGSTNQPLLVRVPGQQLAKPPSGAISAAELLHPPSKTAIRHFAAAEKFSHAGEHSKAVAELQKAVELSPYYTAAWVNLGAEQLYLSHAQEGLQALERASQIGPVTVILLSDLAYAQFCVGRNQEGARSARAALNLDPSHPAAHYLLALFLLRDPRTAAEAVHHLEIAAQTLKSARVELDRLRANSSSFRKDGCDTLSKNGRVDETKDISGFDHDSGCARAFGPGQ